MFSCGFNSGEEDGSGKRLMLLGTFNLPLCWCHPAPSSMTTACAPRLTGMALPCLPPADRSAMRADLGQVQVHRLGVDMRQDQRRPNPAGGTNGTEDVG